MSATSKRLRKQRERLWRTNPHCYYCGNLTELPPHMQHLKNQKDHYATIEHIYSKYNPLRRTPNTTMEQRHVLACYKCNQEKARQDELAVGIEELRRRSGQHKSPKKRVLNKFKRIRWKAQCFIWNLIPKFTTNIW